MFTIDHQRIAAIVKAIDDEQPFAIDPIRDAANLAAAALGIFSESLDDNSEITETEFSNDEIRKGLLILQMVGEIAAITHRLTSEMRTVPKKIRRQRGTENRAKFVGQIRAKAEAIIPRVYEHNLIAVSSDGEKFVASPTDF